MLSYEIKLLSALFKTGEDVSLSSLRNHFYTDLAEVKDALYEEISQKGLFSANPKKVRERHLLTGLLLAFVGGGTASLGGVPSLLPAVGLGAGLVLVGIAMAAMAMAMPRRSAKGRALYYQGLGYKLFVSGTEKYRQPFLEKENVFMEVLPYAIVFGVTASLAKAFKEMGIQPAQPTWYVGTHPFNIVHFGDSIGDFSKVLSTAIASTPGGSGSGGGGFSGGGFGGGGGGSW